jgi:hypothetical protein
VVGDDFTFFWGYVKDNLYYLEIMLIEQLKRRMLETASKVVRDIMEHTWVQGAPPGLKRQGREGDHAPPTNTDVNKTLIYTPTPPYTFMAYCLIS